MKSVLLSIAYFFCQVCQAKKINEDFALVR
jgi:hypothetical protein